MQSHPSKRSDVDELRILASRPDCTEDDLKTAYRRMAQNLHPDHGGDVERFQALQREYEASLERLKEPARRIVASGYPIRPPQRQKPRRRLFVRAFCIVIALVLFTLFLPREARLVVLSLLPALLVFLIVPLLMATLKSHVSVFVFVVSSPILLATIAGILFNDAFLNTFVVADNVGRVQDYFLLSFLITLMALFASTLVGMFFSFSSQR